MKLLVLLALGYFLFRFFIKPENSALLKTSQDKSSEDDEFVDFEEIE